MAARAKHAAMLAGAATVAVPAAIWGAGPAVLFLFVSGLVMPFLFGATGGGAPAAGGAGAGFGSEEGGRVGETVDLGGRDPTGASGGHGSDSVVGLGSLLFYYAGTLFLTSVGALAVFALG